jgi:hypothetical protein
MIVLTGQGDTDVMFVSDEIFDWVMSDYPEELGMKCGDDPNVPEAITEALKAQAIEDAQVWGHEQEEYTVCIGPRSYDNDRALHIPETACIARFFDMKDAMNYAVQNQIVVQNTMEGYIY